MAEAALKGRLADFWKGIGDKNLDAVAAIFTEDAKFLVPGKDVLVGRPAILAHLQEVSAKATTTLDDPKITEVAALTDSLGITGSEFTIVSGGKKLGKSKSLILWKKIGDQWYIYRDAYNN